MDIISKILNYEKEIHDEYILKRQKLLSFLEKIEINKLEKNQLLIFINDLKAIIDPIKISTESINFLFTNTSFKQDKNLKENNYLFLLLFFETFFSETSETSESDDSERVLRSESLSESDS